MVCEDVVQVEEKLAVNLHHTCIKLATKKLMQDEFVMLLLAREIVSDSNCSVLSLMITA